VLKILLNAHSTAVMARMGRIVGNTMTNVNPSNLKLIGRATHLILSHVNDVLSQDEWNQIHGESMSITYAEANAVLFDAMEFFTDQAEQISEVAISIIRILESLKENKDVGWEEALSVAKREGLESYLANLNPALRY
jgi:N-acetylmuramic acid 6-phosphate (MurNAc-6-P) etherase